MQHLTDLFIFFHLKMTISTILTVWNAKKNFISDIFERLMIFKDDYLMI